MQQCILSIKETHPKVQTLYNVIKIKNQPQPEMLEQPNVYQQVFFNTVTDYSCL